MRYSRKMTDCTRPKKSEGHKTECFSYFLSSFCTSPVGPVLLFAQSERIRLVVVFIHCCLYASHILGRPALNVIIG